MKEGVTSFRIYLEGDEEKLKATQEKLCDLLVELGYNKGDKLHAVIACISKTSDVEAWAENAERFFNEVSPICANIAIPDPGNGLRDLVEKG